MQPAAKGRRTPPDDIHKIRDPLSNNNKDLRTWQASVNLRIADLFKTAAGVPGHAMQIQNEINRLSNGAKLDPNQLPAAINSSKKIKKAIEKAKTSAKEEDGYSAPHSTSIQFPLLNDRIKV